MRIPRFLFPKSVTVRGFICGCGHSGTTLIANILAAHPDTYVPLWETGTFKSRSFKTQWIHYSFMWAAAWAGKRVLIEKTPRHVHHLNLIRELVPGARIVIPVRDGRDAVASMFRRYGNLQKSIKRWIEDNRAVIAERGKPDVLIYRHEDLVADPPTFVRRICNFLDLEYSDQLLDFHKEKRLWFRQTNIPHGEGRKKEDGNKDAKHKALRNWQVNQPIFDSSGRWRSELSSDDLAELTQGAGRPLMEAFGYL